MSAAAQAALVRLRRPVGVLVRLPETETLPSLHFSGDLIAAMMVDRAVHHFRVEDADGIVWFVWPSWILGDAPDLAPSELAEAVA